jgi:hypothetical protein
VGDVVWRRIRDFDLEPVRYINLAVASWLLVSAYLWSHSGAQFLITTFVGAVVAILAPFEVGSRRVRHINMACGAMLALAAVALPGTSTGTAWHNAIFGVVLIALSFFGPPHGIMPPRPVAPDDAYEATGGV